MNHRFIVPFLAVLAVSACGAPPELESLPVDYAAQVIIHRDDYGVAHVHGETDAAAAFGFAYAQAEDNFWQIEDNYIRAIGRASEVYGRETLLDDWLNRAFETEALSVAEYESSSPALRAVLDGFAAGLNHYVQTHETIQTRLLDRFEPWYPLAFVRYLYYQQGFLRTSGLSAREFRQAMERSALDEPSRAGADRAQETIPNDVIPSSALPNGAMPPTEQGSNSMAVSPVRSASGHAMLVINPHLPFFGSGQVYEGHIVSDEGWNFSGYTRFGFPMPYVGFNDNLGWASTDNGADQADAYAETFLDLEDGLGYRYGTEIRSASVFRVRIAVRPEGAMQSDSTQFPAGSSAPLDTLVFDIRRTHHGPIVGVSGNRPTSVRMAKFADPGWLDQWYAMTRARDFSSFNSAAARLDMLFGNYLYADREGNILYVYNAAVPKRQEGFNWRGIVDGSDPRTDWNGYHTVEELPQVLNPPSGWIQNCNGSPFHATMDANPEPSAFPRYMVTEIDNARSREARRILASSASFTFEEWAAAAYSTHVIRAEEDLPRLELEFDELRRRNPTLSRELEDAVSLLAGWDRVSRIESEAMTLFVLASEYSTGRALSLGALSQAVNWLEREYGTWRVPWGRLNRLQRVSPNGTGFSDDAVSIPVPGSPSWAGSMFTFWSSVQQGTASRYGTGGNSYVAVVEFGTSVKARTIHTFGTSADPESPHFFDQALHYAAGELKDAWLTLAEVEENAVRSYNPNIVLE